MNLNLTRLGGLCEWLAVALVLVAIGATASAGLTDLSPEPAAMGQWLADVAASQGVYRFGAWSLFVDHLLEIVFILALFQVLRRAGDTLWVAVTAGTLGLLLVSLSGLLQLGLAELAVAYAGAGSAEQASIATSAVALEQIRLAANVTGTTLAWGVGGGLFVLAMLRTDIFPRWLGWLGVVFVSLMWINTLQLIWPALEALFMVAILVAGVWFIGMGWVLMRGPEPYRGEQRVGWTAQTAAGSD